MVLYSNPQTWGCKQHRHSWEFQGFNGTLSNSEKNETPCNLKSKKLSDDQIWDIDIEN